MNYEDIRNHCISKPGAEEGFPFGNDTLVFKVRGKIFLLAGLNSDPQFNVKCNPDKALELREKYPCVIPGYHMNKKHWNTVVIDGSVSATLLKQWIDESYYLVKEK